MRILMVSPYPPLRDGIAAYAVQSVRELRRQGHHVEVLSPTPSAAQHHLRLTGWRGPLALAKRTAAYDRVIVQFHPDVFYPQGCLPAERLAVTLGLVGALRRSRSSELVVHEIDYNRLTRPLHRLAFRALLRSATVVDVHTETERRRLARAVHLRPSAIALREHSGDFRPRTHHDRTSARTALGIPQDAHVFLCIGFIQPHKGFDRALRAFRALGTSRARLYVVGSVRLETPEYSLHAAALRSLAAQTPGAELRLGYLTDELFDRWIVAADTVVLPYRMIWSSGALGRAAILDRPVIASRVGGIADQAPPGTVLVSSDLELLRAMRRAAGVAEGVGPDAAAGASHRVPVPPDADLGAMTSAVRARAAAIRESAGLPGEGAAASPPRDRRLAALTPLRLPTAGGSASRLRRDVKRAVARLTRWELDPIVAHVNALHAAVLDLFGEGREPGNG